MGAPLPSFLPWLHITAEYNSNLFPIVLALPELVGAASPHHLNPPLSPDKFPTTCSPRALRGSLLLDGPQPSPLYLGDGIGLR